MFTKNHKNPDIKKAPKKGAFFMLYILITLR